MYAPKHENPYLNFTPMALRRSIGMMGLLRQVAWREIDFEVWFAESFDFHAEPTWDDADASTAMWAMVTEAEAVDNALYDTVMRINACCIAYCDELLD